MKIREATAESNMQLTEKNHVKACICTIVMKGQQVMSRSIKRH